MSARSWRPLGALIAACALALSACGGGGGGVGGGGGAAAGGDAPNGPVVVGLQPSIDGWSFPNFPSSSFPDINFGTADVVSMFGSDETICVGGVAEPCELTAEAAAWARMVNQARASGHCEGLVVLASSRYNNKETPETVKLPTVDETLGAIMRAFATQFIPEVQENINKWMNVSLADKVEELKRSLATGTLDYTLGVYVAEGGHAVLPYAVEYPSPDVARIMVYDSNWPAKNRYVDVDLAAQTWKFSFSGEDPENDPAIWTGGPADMDLTSFDARAGTCPFCGKDVKVAKTTLLIRSANLEWSVESGDQVVTPETGVNPDGASAQPVKGMSISSTSPQQGGGRSSYDYMVQIPNELLDEFLASQGSSTTTTVAPTGGVNLNFTGPSSVFAMTPTGIAEVKTEGTSNEPIKVTRNSIKTKDPTANITLASENLVANASGSQVELQTSDTGMQVTVTAPNGQVITQDVTPDQPVVQMVADPASGGITVLAQTPTGEVQKTEVAPDGSQTTSVLEPGSLNLNKTEVELPKGLESKPIESLPPLENRNLANPDYKPDTPYVAPTTVAPRTESTSGGQVAAGATTTVAGRATTTTVAGRGVNSASNSQSAASDDPVRPKLGDFNIATKTFGDAAFTLDPPASDSSGGFRYTSSKPEVATVALLTGRVTIVGAGTTTITATQSAVRGFTTATATATLTVTKARPDITKPSALSRTFGDEAFTLRTPTSSSTGTFTYDSSDDKVARVNRTSGRVTIVGAGRTTISMNQAATDNHLAGSTDVVLTVRKATPSPAFGAASAEVTKTFGDADFDVTAPTSESKGAFTFTSSDANVVSVTSAGRASVKGVGTATITAAQAATDDHLAASTTMTVRVNRAGAGLSGFTDVSKVFGDAKFTLTAPKSAGTGAFTYSSDNTQVVSVNSTSGEVTIVGAGSATITATQAESATHAGGTITSKVTVDKAAPSITKFDPTNVKFDDVFTLAPESTSSGAFTFSTDKSDIFEVGATTGRVKVLAMGTATLTVRQAATSNYEAASRSVTITVAKATPTIGTFSLPAMSYDDVVTPTAPTSNSNGAFTYSSDRSDRVIVQSNGTLKAVGVGVVTITASQAESARYVARSVTTTITIDKAAPILTNFVVPSKTVGDAPFQLQSPTSTRSPASFTYAVVPSSDPSAPIALSNVASVTSSGLVTVLGPGEAVIRATQAGDANHVTATIDATFTVLDVPTIGAFVISAKTFGDAPFTFVAPTSNSNGSFSYTSSNPSVATVNSATRTITIVGAGSTTITAAQAATSAFAEGSTAATFTVNRATPLLSGFGQLTSGLSGTRYNGYFSDDVSWFATAPKHGDTVVSTSINGFTSNAEQYSWEWLGVFRSSTSGSYQFCTESDDASFLWLGSEAASGFTVANSLVNNGGLHGPEVQCGAKELLANTAYDIRIQFGEFTGGDIMSVYFVPPNGSPIYDGTGYFFSSGSVSKTLGDASFTLTPPTSPSSGSITYSSSNTSVAEVNQNTGLISITGVGTAIITATQAETANYTSATTSRTVVVTTGSTPIANGMVSHLDAANSASYGGSGAVWTDLSGNGRNATLSNVTHNSDGYMVFNGSNGYADWGQPLESGTNYTIEGWVWSSSYDGPRNIASTADAPFWFNSGQLSAGVGGGCCYSLVSKSPNPLNTWIHVAVTFDDTANTMILYRDGVAVSSKTNVSTSFSKQWLTIGAHNNGSGAMSNFEGRMAQLRLYDRALSSADIAHNRDVTKASFGQ